MGMATSYDPDAETLTLWSESAAEVSKSHEMNKKIERVDQPADLAEALKNLDELYRVVDELVEAHDEETKRDDETKSWVLGFAFNDEQNRVLLVEKAGKWNGVGGQMWLDGETPFQAMTREALEETGRVFVWSLVATVVVHRRGTVFVFRATASGPSVLFDQGLTDETLRQWLVKSLPADLVTGVEWMVPFCLSTVRRPVTLEMTT